MEMARTRPSPRCWATSRVSVFFAVLGRVGDLDVQGVVDVRHRVDGELHVDDRADDPGDAARGDAVAGLNSGRHYSVTPRGRVGQGARATDDLADFLGDFGLAGRVGKPGERLDRALRRCRSPTSSRGGVAACLEAADCSRAL